MTNVLIINGHHSSSGSAGKLNASFVERAEAFFAAKGFNVEKSIINDGYDIQAEVDKIARADVVFVQSPINWMSIPWAFKKYLDEVWMLGLRGTLSAGDGRTAAAPKENYGLGGKLTGKYMFSVTGNAPKEAFNNPAEGYFAGVSEDDVLLPLHLNFKWIGLTQLPTFVAYDVMKDPQIESDFKRFDAHLNAAF